MDYCDAVFPTGFCETCGGRRRHTLIGIFMTCLHTDELWHFRSVEAARHNEGMGSTGGCLWECRQLSSTQNEPNETRRARGDFPLVNRLWMVSFSARPGKVYVWETLCDVFISCLDSHSDGTHSLHQCLSNGCSASDTFLQT